MRAARFAPRRILTSSLVALALSACAGKPDAIAFVTVDPTQPGNFVQAGYIGFSHEWGQAQLLMGDPAIGVNPIYRQLVKNLAAHGGGPVSIRVGGSTTDRTGAPRPNTVTPLARLYDDLSAPAPTVSFILGVNLGADDVGLATRQAKAYLEGMPPGSVQAIEVGNEPDTYESQGHRRAGWGWAGYMADFHEWTQSIKKAVPDGPKFTGPANAGFPGTPPAEGMPASDFGTTEGLTQLLSTEKDVIGFVTQHAYTGGSSACGGAPAPGFLLEPGSATEDPKLVRPLVALARGGVKPYRIGEMNSILCAGEPGISDAFEAALWTADVLFEYAAAGVVGVNLHTNNWNALRGWDISGAFLFDVPEAQYTASATEVAPPEGNTFTADYQLRKVLPAYYGLWFFTEATSNQGQILPVTLETTANLKAWATLDSSTGDVYVAIINKDQTATGTVRMIVPGYPLGRVKRLLAPSFSATEGITFGGQTFDGSTDGNPVGTEQSEDVQSKQNGVFEIVVAPTSAVLLQARR